MAAFRPIRRLLLVFAAGIGLGLVFSAAVRPWFIRWGATDTEVRRGLPGDAIVPSASRQGTRAITIKAPVELVWPWLAQLGQDRGGFYSYAVLENLVGCRMPSADRIHPEFQAWKLGDKLWMYPPDRAGGAGHATLADYEPGRALGFATWQIGTLQGAPRDGSWSFVLEPIDDATTRLLVRGRAADRSNPLALAFDRLFFDPLHFVMERKMMLGLKAHAEGRAETSRADVLEVLAWVAVLAVFLASGAWVLRLADWPRPLALLVASGGAFQFLTFAQPGPLVAAAVLAPLAWGVAWTRRLPAGPR